jgi:23S rRNA (cytidine1920-2'-O)/16S rRNA (cytidine1409-2'-O)-methyltransferase
LTKMAKTRLDMLIVERGLSTSRAQAQRLVMAGQVRLNGETASKPSVMVSEETEITIDQPPRFVSRGGEKLDAAWQAFGLNWEGQVCADVGASTGGFSDCLLQHGAAKVYAIDVGRGILDWKIRNHSQVICVERTNARYLANLPETVRWITVDVSFISLRVFFPIFKGWFPKRTSEGERLGNVVALIKPQFEAGRAEAGRGKGVIRDPRIHRRVLEEVLESATAGGYGVDGLMRSPITGSKGNVEFLTWLTWGDEETFDITRLVDSVFD